jgi:hypothetical protein
MNPIPDILERLKARFFRDRLERELEEELRHHRELDEQAGISPSGRLEEIKEAVRDARGVRPLEELIADTRYALRAGDAGVGLTRRRLSIVLVVPADPFEPPAPLVPPLGHQIEVVVRRVEQVDAARVGRVGMKHSTRRILVEDAHPLPLG